MPTTADWAEKPFPLVPTPTASLPKGQKPDVFDDTASEMANAHNLFIRCLNSIYQQAPHVKLREVHSFLGYAQCWARVVGIHHDGEELDFFPAIERMTGEPGVMGVNLEQHAAFHDGLVGFREYVEACQRGDEEYDGSRVRRLIDGFGGSLTQHLHEEIPTLLSLRRFGHEKMAGLHKALGDDAKNNLSRCGMAAGVVLCIVTHDVSFEDGLWPHFPPIPWPVMVFLKNVLYHVHSDWWKFAPSDAYGRPKAQYAAPDSK